MNYMGIDVHSGSCEFAVINESGNVLEQSSFQTSLENLIEVAEKVKKPLNIVFEEGELAGWLYRGLLGYADDIVVADPVHNRLIYGSDQKSDKLDPVKLANLLRGGFINRVHHSSDEHHIQFKQTVLSYHDVSKQLTRFKNKLKSYYRKCGVIIRGQSIYNPDNRERYLSMLQDCMIVENYHGMVDFFIEKKDELEKMIKRESRRYPQIKKFTTIPGVGIITAATFYAIIETPHRFHNKQSLWSYAHLGKASYESGDKERKRRQKKGNRLLKYVILQVITNSKRSRNNPFRKKYLDEVLIKKKDPRLAKRISGRSLLTTMWTMWKNGESYKA